MVTRHQVIIKHNSQTVTSRLLTTFGHSPCIRKDWRRLALGWRCIPRLDKHNKKESQNYENSHEYFFDAIHK